MESVIFARLSLNVGQLDIVPELFHHLYKGIVYDLFRTLNESVHI